MKFKLSIVIPVYNNYNFTVKCLEDLSYLPNDHEIIIVDNGSSDNTKKIVSDNARLKIIRNKTNQGFASAVNIGYSMSSGENVMFLNNDIRLRSNKENWTKEIIEVAESGEFLVGPTIGVLDDNFNFITEANKMPLKGHVYMSGWNITANVKTWGKLVLENEIGPWNTDFFCYFEDTDLGFRAQELGVQLKIVDCPVHHFGKMTSSKIGTLNLYLPAKEKFIKKWSGRWIMKK